MLGGLPIVTLGDTIRPWKVPEIYPKRANWIYM